MSDMIDFEHERRRLKGIVSPKSLIDSIGRMDSCEMKLMVITVQNIDGTFDVFHTHGVTTEKLGLIEIGKALLIEDLKG